MGKPRCAGTGFPLYALLAIGTIELNNDMKPKTPRKTKATKSPSKPTLPTVHLEFEAPQASDVCVAGSFNSWHPAATPMINLGNGRWAKDVVLPPGRYEYLFVVDGRCVADPRARESAPNVFGCVNSVLFVPAGAPPNGCKRRIFGRKPLGSLRPHGKSKPWLCRSVNTPRGLLTPS